MVLTAAFASWLSQPAAESPANGEGHMLRAKHSLAVISVRPGDIGKVLLHR